MKNKYLVSCDLDDTLLTSKKKISRKNKKFANRFVKNGNFFLINTGRPWQGAYMFHQALEMSNEPMVVSNGAAIVYFDEKYNITSAKTFSISVQDVISVYQDLKKYSIAFMTYSLYNYYYSKRSLIPDYLIHLHEKISHHEGELDSIIEEEQLGMQVYAKKENKEIVENILKEEYPQLGFTFWGYHNDIAAFEIYSKHASKGQALEFLAKELKVTKTISYGDNLNDFDMLMKADYGVAMVNGCEEIKAVTNYHTKRNFNHSGVSHHLNKLLKRIEKNESFN